MEFGHYAFPRKFMGKKGFFLALQIALRGRLKRSTSQNPSVVQVLNHLKLICFVVHYNDGIQEVIIRENSNFAWVYKSQSYTSKDNIDLALILLSAIWSITITFTLLNGNVVVLQTRPLNWYCTYLDVWRHQENLHLKYHLTPIHLNSKQSCAQECFMW